MNTFNKKSLHVAVLTGLGALGTSTAVHPVDINQKKREEIIPFPKLPKQDRRGRSFNPKIGQGKHVSKRSMTGHRSSNKKGKGK